MTLADVLRLVAVPVLGWAAYRDVQVRRVPSRTWYPLVALGVALLAFEVYQVQSGGRTLSPYARRLFFVQIGVSLGVVVPVSYLVWRVGGFGGADAKALMALAVLFPGYPNYALAAGVVLPLPAGRTVIGAFSLTILTNTVLLGAAYPVALAARNLLSGDRSRMMLFGRPAPAESIVERHGSLLETPEGYTRQGLDLDALRMYLRWRETTLAEIREAPGRFRDPASLPDDRTVPGDGAIETDGGRPPDEGTAGEDGPPSSTENAHGEGPQSAADAHGDGPPPDVDPDDEWGAAAFLDDLGWDAYGTSPGDLRGGLELLATREAVWYSPGVPFIVPMFLGLVVALTLGDLLFYVLGWLALA